MIASYIAQRYSHSMMSCIDWLLINLVANDPGKGWYPNGRYSRTGIQKMLVSMKTHEPRVGFLTLF